MDHVRASSAGYIYLEVNGTSAVEGGGVDTVLDSNKASVEYGAYNLWEFFEYGERVSCKNLRVFLHFLVSSGSRRVEVTSVLEEFGVAFRIQGPTGDDGTPGLLEYQLTLGEARSFGAEETEVLLSAIARDESPERAETAENVARVLGLRKQLA